MLADEFGSEGVAMGVRGGSGKAPGRLLGGSRGPPELAGLGSVGLGWALRCSAASICAEPIYTKIKELPINRPCRQMLVIVIIIVIVIVIVIEIITIIINNKK